MGFSFVLLEDCSAVFGLFLFVLCLFCFALFICFSLRGWGFCVWGACLCCFLLAFLVCFSWETLMRQSKVVWVFFQGSQTLALVQGIICSQQLKSSAIRA